MNTAVIITKTEPQIKAKAQKIAKELGFSLSSLVNAYLRQLVKTKTVTFTTTPEIPNKKTRAILKQAEKNWKEGKHSPIFKTGKEAVAWLDKQGI
ncbi:type II toxin-antitoxin system RelB/DinJ family antitoxin [Candidatus Gottesmanbacteria bacterium]|nr:type II toxin-antitoxin system RelB/DinJ family antitoxin [Candidatus Gottesmanbacteria bacterium]